MISRFLLSFLLSFLHELMEQGTLKKPKRVLRPNRFCHKLKFSEAGDSSYETLENFQLFHKPNQFAKKLFLSMETVFPDSNESVNATFWTKIGQDTKIRDNRILRRILK